MIKKRKRPDEQRLLGKPLARLAGNPRFPETMTRLKALRVVRLQLEQQHQLIEELVSFASLADSLGTLDGILGDLDLALRRYTVNDRTGAELSQALTDVQERLEDFWKNHAWVDEDAPPSLSEYWSELVAQIRALPVTGTSSLGDHVLGTCRLRHIVEAEAVGA